MAVAASSNDRLELVAAALTSLIPGSKVITKYDPLYATLKQRQQLTYKIIPLTYQLMSQNVIVESRPEPDPMLVIPFDKTMSMRLLSPDLITIITVRFLNGQSDKYSIDAKATVYALKWTIFKSKGFEEYEEYDINNIVLTFDGTELNDDDKLLKYYGIKYGSLLKVFIKIRGAAETTILVIDENLLDPGYDYDFTHIDDKGRVYKRGGHVYKRPCGWKRIALKVAGQYEDDKWLGCSGLPGEWPVSYHGTGKERAEGIAKIGYSKEKLKRSAYGKGHYSTPDINVAANLYAKSFPYGGKWYKAVMQNRVNLSPGYTTIIPEEKTGAGAEYYVTPSADDLRAYGICIKEVSAYNFLC